jgi:hypothetical protein
MAITIKQIEGVPASYPSAPSGLSTAAAALSNETIWLRIEQWISHRFASRTIQWVVEGCGEWVPNLVPATITTVESWSCGASVWEVADPALEASPMGGYLLRHSGPYRFTGAVGAGPVPEAVSEGYRRLAEYLAASPGSPGASSYRSEVIGIGTEEVTRAQSWMAKALHNSGAADLLRPYRRP